MKKKYVDPAASDQWLSLALRLLVGGVFLYAGFGKASAPAEEFAAVIEAYAVLPPGWALPLARVLPWAELVFGAYLAAGYWTRASARMLGAMLLLFIGALVSAILRGIPLDNCGCFGSSLHIPPPLAVAFDAALLGCAWRVSSRAAGRWSADHWVRLGSGP